MKNPEYKLIVDDQKQVKISLRALKEGECLQNIDEAINRVYSVKRYIEEIFEKRNTTKHPARKPDAVNIEFVEVSETPAVQEQKPAKPEEPKLVKLKRGRKLKSSLILNEDDEEEAEAQAKEKVDIKADIKADSGEFEEIEVPINPVKDIGKTKKRKNAKIKVNPPGKTRKKKIAPENIEFVEDSN